MEIIKNFVINNNVILYWIFTIIALITLYVIKYRQLKDKDDQIYNRDFYLNVLGILEEFMSHDTQKSLRHVEELSDDGIKERSIIRDLKRFAMDCIYPSYPEHRKAMQVAESVLLEACKNKEDIRMLQQQVARCFAPEEEHHEKD